jgi:hypothetical protein
MSPWNSVVFQTRNAVPLQETPNLLCGMIEHSEPQRAQSGVVHERKRRAYDDDHH